MGVFDRARRERVHIMQYEELPRRFEAAERFESAQMWGSRQFEEVSGELRRLEIMVATIINSRRKIEDFLSAIRGLRTSWELTTFDTSSHLWFFLKSTRELLIPKDTDFNVIIVQARKEDVRWIQNILSKEYRECTSLKHAFLGSEVFVSADHVQQVQCRQCSAPAYLVGRYGPFICSDTEQKWELILLSLCLSCMELEKVAICIPSLPFF